jgi:hypothetical protein
VEADLRCRSQSRKSNDRLASDPEACFSTSADRPRDDRDDAAVQASVSSPQLAKARCRRTRSSMRLPLADAERSVGAGEDTWRALFHAQAAVDATAADCARRCRRQRQKQTALHTRG